MSAQVRALNRSLDGHCTKLEKDTVHLEDLLAERTCLLDRLAVVDTQIKRTQAIIKCRNRDISMLMEQLPLTQASPESQTFSTLHQHDNMHIDKDNDMSASPRSSMSLHSDKYFTQENE